MLKVAAVLATAVVASWAGSAVASAQPRCAELGGTVDAGICQIHTANPNFAFDASYPLDYPDEAALADYLTQTRDGFVNVAEMPDSGYGLPYQLDIKSTQYRSGVAPDGTQSVVFEVYENVGGPHPLTWYKAFNYNLNTRQPITFDTLFLPGTKPLDVIFPVVSRELEREVGRSDLISPGAGKDPSRYQNFAITDDELIFFFGQDELLPSPAGANVVHVPRAAVAPMLAPLPPPPPR